jgi:N-terminal C2 in EEIG1 and EHBP1 proteins
MSHIGTVPFKFKVDIFVSYVDLIKSTGEVSVTCERRSKTVSTGAKKVKDKKAVFRETISIETTLFKRATPGQKLSAELVPGEQLNFDEKVAKIVLRKGGADGKAIGKIHLNLADYIKGTTGTVFADLKLSNGSVVVTKIESNVLHTGGNKKSRNGSDNDSVACSEATDLQEGGMMDDDSIFGDDAEDPGDLEIPVEEQPKEVATSIISPSKHSEKKQKNSTDTVGRDMPSLRVSNMESEECEIGDAHVSPTAQKEKLKDDSWLQGSPSLRDKIKGKIKKDKEARSLKAEKIADKNAPNTTTWKSTQASGADVDKSALEIPHLRDAIAALTKENLKLKASKQAMMIELDELRDELKVTEQNAGENARGRGRDQDRFCPEEQLREENKVLARTVRGLEAQVEGLLDELDENRESVIASRQQIVNTNGKVNSYEKTIEDLEIALKREPQFLDVVSELKVTKMALALASMEKEQALFALKKCDALESPLSVTPNLNNNAFASRPNLFGKGTEYIPIE